MTDHTDAWRIIFTDLTNDSGCYEIDKVNIYQLTSHLEELYLTIDELQNEINMIKNSIPQVCGKSN